MRIASVLIVGALASLSFADGFSFTFDSDNQGWTQGELGSNVGATDPDFAGGTPWNPGGWLDGLDNSNYAFTFSPDLGGGHGTLFGEELTFDFRAASNQGVIPFVTLLSSTDQLILERAYTSTTTMQPFSFTLDSSEGWYINSATYFTATPTVASDAQIQAVLNDLRYVGVTSDLANGGDETDLDNVMAVPEPASMIALGAGLAALAARRRNRKA